MPVNFWHVHSNRSVFKTVNHIASPVQSCVRTKAASSSSTFFRRPPAPDASIATAVPGRSLKSNLEQLARQFREWFTTNVGNAKSFADHIADILINPVSKHKMKRHIWL